MASTTEFKILKLNGANYRDWTFNMRLYLESLDLFGHVDGTAEVPNEDASDKERREFNFASKKAWTYICLAVEPEQQIHVRNTTTAKQAWDALKGQFARTSISQMVRLRQRYYSSKFQSGGNILEHINQLKSVYDQLKEMGANIDDGELAMTLLASLPDEFKPLITALDAVGEEKISFEKVKAILLNDADRFSDAIKYEDAYSAQCGNRGRKNEAGENNRGKENKNGGKESKHGRQFQGTCHYCKDKGHFARDCPKRRNNTQQNGNQNCGNQGKGKRSACCAEGESDSESIVEEALYTCNDEHRRGWIIDSGATQHMTFERSHLTNYIEFKKPCAVNLGDNRSILAFGKGTYHMKADLGDHIQNISLHEVLYLPDLEKNLLSVHAMVNRGAVVIFKENVCEISRNSKILAVGEVEGKLYMLKADPREYANVAKKDVSMELWHCRFGHLGMENILKLVNNNMVEGMPICRDGDVEVCESCVMGKQHRTPYPKNGSEKATQSFEIVYSDVCGPMHIKSFGKSQYFVTFIDDYSRYTQVYFIQHKDQVLEKFKEYVNLANASGKKVRVLRSDNGGEYCSKAFDEYLKNHGIVHQTTVPYCPEQNGTAERMNRTLVESARSMMYHARTPKEFWAEAISTATFVRNRSPTSSLNGMTPFERLFGRKPDVSSLRVFGCIAFAHVPDNQRKKLEEKSRKCIFIGYPGGTKGFKLYDLATRSFIQSRDVIFQERNFHDFKSREHSDSYFQEIDDVQKRSEMELPISLVEIPDRNDNQDDGRHEINNQVEDNPPVGESYEDHFMREVENLNPQRPRRPPQRYDDEVYCCIEDLTADINEPRNISEAWNGEHSTDWRKATDSEFGSLINNKTWELVPLPKGKNIVGSRWVFKVKRDENGTVKKFKARLVAQGYSQTEGVDYSEVFSPVVRNTTIRTLLALANEKNWDIHQMDVKTAFLQGNLEDEIYMRQPSGYINKKHPNYVCKLRKSIYGLKQSARCWNNAIDEYLKNDGYAQMNSDPCLYMKSFRRQDGIIAFVILSIHVDDILFSNDTGMLNDEKAAIGSRFKVEDFGEVKHVLGMLVKRDRSRRRMTISQPKYLEGVLKRFKMEHCKPVSTPLEPGKQFRELSEEENPVNVKEYQKLIGCLTYATTATRPDLASALGILSKYMSKPSQEHWQGAKRVLRYIKGTLNHGLVFDGQNDDCKLIGYSDADWANDVDTRRSTSGYTFQINSSLISWCSKKQSCVSRSSTEAEYIALSFATQEAIWLRRLLEDIGVKQGNPTVMYEDNQGAIVLTKDPKFHNRTKHIDIAHHFVREKVNDKSISVEYCRTEDMAADIMTKSLPRQAFYKFRELLGVKEIM